MEDICWAYPTNSTKPFRASRRWKHSDRGLFRIVPAMPAPEKDRDVNMYLLELCNMTVADLKYRVPDVNNAVLWEEFDRYTQTPEAAIPQQFWQPALRFVETAIVRKCSGRVASLEEAIASMDKHKAAGEPWRTTKENVVQAVFLTEDGQQWTIEQLVAALRSGELQVWAPYSGFLKIELRTGETVDGEWKWKTPHNIAIQEVLLLILTKLYCHHFNESFYNLWSDPTSFSVVGMPMEFGNWHRMCEYLAPAGEDRVFFHFDVSKLNYVIPRVWYTFETLMRLSRLQTEEERDAFNLVSALNQACYSYLVHRDGTVVEVDHCTKSGDGNTTVRNTLFTIWFFVCLLLAAGVPLREVARTLRLRVGGDDGAGSRPRRWLKDYNATFERLRDIAKSWGVGLKGSDVERLEDVEFLSHRPFYCREIGSWVPVPADFEKVRSSVTQPTVKSGPSLWALRFVAQMKRCCFNEGQYLYLRSIAETLVQRHKLDTSNLEWQEVEMALGYSREYYMKRYAHYM